MANLLKMRQGVLRELKNIRRFLDNLESSVKSRNPQATETAYCYIKTLVYHMNEGDLTPLSIALHRELLLKTEKEDER